MTLRLEPSARNPYVCRLGNAARSRSTPFSTMYFSTVALPFGGAAIMVSTHELGSVFFAKNSSRSVSPMRAMAAGSST